MPSASRPYRAGSARNVPMSAASPLTLASPSPRLPRCGLSVGDIALAARSVELTTLARGGLDEGGQAVYGIVFGAERAPTEPAARRIGI